MAVVEAVAAAAAAGTATTGTDTTALTAMTEEVTEEATGTVANEVAIATAVIAGTRTGTTLDATREIGRTAATVVTETAIGTVIEEIVAAPLGDDAARARDRRPASAALRRRPRGTLTPRASLSAPSGSEVRVRLDCLLKKGEKKEEAKPWPQVRFLVPQVQVFPQPS